MGNSGLCLFLTIWHVSLSILRMLWWTMSIWGGLLVLKVGSMPGNKTGNVLVVENVWQCSAAPPTHRYTCTCGVCLPTLILCIYKMALYTQASFIGIVETCHPLGAVLWREFTDNDGMHSVHVHSWSLNRRTVFQSCR